MRVLVASHWGMSRTTGQPKLHSLARYPDLQVTSLVPDKMFFYGKWEHTQAPEPAEFRHVSLKARAQWVAGQWYLQHFTEGIVSLFREGNFDVVDIWLEPWGLACTQLMWLTRRYCPNARVIVETEQNIYRKLPPPFRYFQTYNLKRADSMIARQLEGVEVLRNKGYGGPVHVVPNAVDTELFQPLSEPERRQMRSSLGWGDPNAFIFGYVGRLVEYKGLTEMLEALSMLPPEFRLLFVGDGPQREDLENMTRDRGLTGRVHFAGSRPLGDLPGYMNAMDALVLPSRTTRTWKEQFGRVIIEAGACRVAVVGSDSGAIPEVIAEGGLVFPEGDSAALAGQLQRLHDDPALRARCAKAGLRRAHELFRWECVAATMRSIYYETSGQPVPSSDIDDPRPSPHPSPADSSNPAVACVPDA